jgi:protein-S-isoprenylcysteine O-methyltransferase Ste14
MALQEEFELQGNFLFRYRGVLPILILFLTIFAYVLHILYLPVNQLNVLDGFYSYMCLLITFVGFGIRIYTVGHSPKNTSGRNTTSQIADELNTKGIYSVVRHPLYVGNFFMWFGIAMLTLNPWFMLAFIFIYWVYYERIMFAEEQFLRKKFGDNYLQWAASTPAFIPDFKNYQPSASKFQIKKVLIQEKTGFLLIFLMYFLFDQIGTAIVRNKIAIIFDFWFYAMIAGIIGYLTIKLTQKKTTVIKFKIS